MRIAYISNYQGYTLVARRPIIRNLSLAARVKTERIAELLLRAGHQVEILSQGEVVDRPVKFHEAFVDPQPFHAEVPIRYASAIPVRFVNGLWASVGTLRLLMRRHRWAPFDVIVINNLKPPQVLCAAYGIRRLRLPVILQYDDGHFGKDKHTATELTARIRRVTSQPYLGGARWLLPRLSGCVAVSPELMAQTPSSIPRVMLRGVVGDEIAAASRSHPPRRSRVVFSGTHYRAYRLEALIAAWRALDAPGWELHIAGQGELTTRLQEMARGSESIVFHGLLNRQQNAELLASARIGINPHEVDHTFGNVFAFKIVEYLCAGLHVLTTPMGGVQPELEPAITYMGDNAPATIADRLHQVIHTRKYEATAGEGALRHYGADAVSRSLNQLLQDVMQSRSKGGHYGSARSAAAFCHRGTADSQQ